MNARRLLGLVITWSGYTLLVWGYAKWKEGGQPGTPTLSLSDIALPSHRPAYLVAMNAYSTATAGITPSGGTNKSPKLGPALPPSPAGPQRKPASPFGG